MGHDQNVPGKISPEHRPAEVLCEVCGKNQEKCFEVHLGGERHIFDSFECAMGGLLPTCSQCGRVILGSGVLIEGSLYCAYPFANP